MKKPTTKNPVTVTETNLPTPATPAALVPQARRYDEAFKRQAVEQWIKTGKPGTQIARELGVSYPCLKDWKRRYWGDATPERDDLADENRALRAELARVREQRDILKKTLGIFAEPSKRVTNGSKP